MLAAGILFLRKYSFIICPPLLERPYFLVSSDQYIILSCDYVFASLNNFSLPISKVLDKSLYLFLELGSPLSQSLPFLFLFSDRPSALCNLSYVRQLILFFKPSHMPGFPFHWLWFLSFFLYFTFQIHFFC